MSSVDETPLDGVWILNRICFSLDSIENAEERDVALDTVVDLIDKDMMSKHRIRSNRMV
jgi:hypothetical protein